MKINQSILTDLLERTPIPPPETGGILGGQAGVITRYYADMGVSHMPAHYMPHADILNRVIERWKAERIDFYGIFHSHYKRDRVLSKEDIQYIEKIMWGVPQTIETLYFPIVLPQQEIIVYRADKADEGIRIVCEEIEIN